MLARLIKGYVRGLLLILPAFLFFLLLGSTESFAQNRRIEYRIKTVYLQNFIKEVKWPEESVGKVFKVGIVKDPQFAEVVRKWKGTKKVGSVEYPIEVVPLQSLDNAKDFQVLYTGAESGYLPSDLLSAIGKAPILLVTENYDYGTTMINFVIQNSKLQYEVNVVRIESNKLVIENELLDRGLSPEDEEEFQRIAREMRRRLNSQLDKNQQQTKTIAKLSQEINRKKDSIALTEAYLDSIQEDIIKQRVLADRLRDQVDSNAAEILRKERALEDNDLKLTKQMVELEKAKKNFQEIERDMSNISKTLEDQKLVSMVAFLIAVLIAVLLIIAYRSFIKQRKQAVVINRQKEEAEIQRDEIQTQHLQLADKNKEITDSITYAKRIQDAMLPPLDVFRANLEKSFIFYLPKDIVAGDFYWMEKADNKVIFAAADCTGHGVPGAIVSVICSNALNRSVREFKLSKPSAILDQTLEIVIEKFNSTEDEVKDGMDIALCSFDPKTNILEYAGANNPLWIIRKDSQEIEDYKANKQPVGRYLKHEPFTNHSIQLNEGDTIYLFSDGYADQFGGEMGKKFRSIHFKELLISIQDKDMKAQKRMVEKSFYGWKGKLDQLDDICVMGFRV